MTSKIDPALIETIKQLAGTRDDMVALAEALAAAKAVAPGQTKKLIALVGLSPAAGYSLIAIGRKLPQLGPDRARLNRIGWGKLRLVLPRLGGAPLAALLDLAEAATSDDLPALLKGRPRAPGTRRFAFVLAPDEERRLVEALVACGAHQTRRGLKRKEAALMRLLTLRLAREPAQPGANPERKEI